MKTQLTTIQSRRLIEAGVSPDKASEKVTDPDTGQVSVVFTIPDLICLIPDFWSGKFTMVQEKFYWAVGTKYEKDGWKHVIRKPELIDALCAFVLWLIHYKFIKVSQIHP